MKPIPLKVNTPQYFDTFLELLRPLKPFSEFRGVEIKVAAQLLYHAFKHRNLEDQDKWNLVFHYDTKMEIAKYLNIPPNSLANALTRLRGFKFIQNNTIRKEFLFNPIRDTEIVYKFNINNNE